MKKLTLTWLILFAFCVLGYAGPETSSGKEMKQVAPPPPAGCFDWSGVYVGGFGGYKRSNVDQHLSLGGDWNFTGGAQGFTENRGSGDLDNDGGEVGGLVGYNWQFNCWVFGIEASGAYLFAQESSDTGIFAPGDDVSSLHIASSFKTHYLATFAPRFGYAWGRFLPYVTGGLAVGDLDYAQHLRFPDESGEGGQTRQTNAGWMVGGGLQYALTDHWSVRAQYEYIDLGNVQFDSDFAFDGDSPAHHEAKLTEHNASFAIIYKF
jgi:outer membrane immunogenic protein